ncbi:MAG: TonB family protein, partial [Hyphomonadaceae bacterium]
AARAAKRPLLAAHAPKGYRRPMLVWATRRLPAAFARGLILLGLFIVVVVLQIGLTSGLRAMGASPGLALGLSGFGVLGAVLALNWQARVSALRQAEALEAARLRHHLPDGPCCVVWRGGGTPEAAMPWTIEGGFRAAYPAAAQKLGVEGLAVIDFEIGADGRAKNLHCVEVWPSQLFYSAAAKALEEARFAPKAGAEVRFGASYQLPFVFRIAGAAKIKERGHRARRRRPRLDAAAAAAETAARQAVESAAKRLKRRA